MKRWIALAAILILGACILIPKPGFTEDKDTVLLARAVYTLVGLSAVWCITLLFRNGAVEHHA